MPIPLRADFDAQTVRAAARRSKDGPQAPVFVTNAEIGLSDGVTLVRERSPQPHRSCVVSALKSRVGILERRSNRCASNRKCHQCQD
jgi:hypothetical protein